MLDSKAAAGNFIKSNVCGLEPTKEDKQKKEVECIDFLINAMPTTQVDRVYYPIVFDETIETLMLNGYRVEVAFCSMGRKVHQISPFDF